MPYLEFFGPVIVLRPGWPCSGIWTTRPQDATAGNRYMASRQRLRRNNSIWKGSAGVAPAVFGLWPKTFRREKEYLLVKRLPSVDQSARRRLERPRRSRSPFSTESLRLRIRVNHGVGGSWHLLQRSICLDQPLLAFFFFRVLAFLHGAEGRLDIGFVHRTLG